MMSLPDSQWPRWEVFKQDSPQKPHQAVGSVHAADPEHALLNARHVFARRPAAVSMWVVKADRIFSKTQEQLATQTFSDVLSSSSEAYVVFCKMSHKRSMVFMDYLCELEANSPEHAWRKVLEQYAGQKALAWWIIAKKDLVKSSETPEIIESWFAPAKEKTYKQQSSYGVIGNHPGQRQVEGDND